MWRFRTITNLSLPRNRNGRRDLGDHHTTVAQFLGENKIEMGGVGIVLPGGTIAQLPALAMKTVAAMKAFLCDHNVSHDTDP